MTPVLQTVMEVGKGNCFAACIASLLDLPIENVPNFVGEEKEGQHWMDACNAWLRPRGHVLLCLQGNAYDFWFPDGVPFIVSAKSPRGEWNHACVCEFRGNGALKMLHDPHPSGDGFRPGAEPEFYYYLVALPALLAVARKARAVANEGWGTCITDQQHSRRMAKMDALREALKAL